MTMTKRAAKKADRELWVKAAPERVKKLLEAPAGEVRFASERGGTRISVSGARDDAAWTRAFAKLFVALEGAKGKTHACEISEKVAVSADDAWAAVGSAEGLSRWFASGGSLDDESYSLEAGPSRIEGAVLERVEGKALSIAWNIWPCKQSTLPAPTFVSITVAPEKGGAKITLVHSGFGDTEEWAGAMEEHAETWKFLVANLKSVLERGVDLRKGA